LCSGKQNNRLLTVEKQRISSPEMSFSFIVEEEPLEAGIDPNYLLIDRFPDDNVMKLEKVE
jgi:ABC-2 type transport system permease protein